MTLRHIVGSLLIVGLDATSLTPVEQAWLRMIRPGGVILFRRNIEEAIQVHSLLSAVEALSGNKLLRCVDLEGGLVDRLRDLVAPMPSAAAVASTGKRRLARDQGRTIAKELRLFGFNTTFAPVVDLALPASAQVMRTRSTSPDPHQVIAYARGFLYGLASGNVLGCGKHFPGLGGGTLDSHHETPEIQRPWEELWKEDLLPYRKLKTDLPMIMVSHAAYPRVKTANGPASVSRYWITDVLRHKIGYNGLILSDDMEMGGILKRHSIEEASIRAIEAGTDLLEICKEPELVLRTYEALLSEAEKSSSFRRKVEQAGRRVARRKRRLLRRDKMGPAPNADALEEVRTAVRTFTHRVEQAGTRAKALHSLAQ